MSNMLSSVGMRMAIAGSAALLLAACQETGLYRAQSITQLAPCTASGSIFGDKDFEDWGDAYHELVSSVVEAHIDSMTDISGAQLRCTEEEYTAVVPPSGKLREMAENLPAWEGTSRLDDLSETDAGAVLMEFLRVYECSLNERALFLSTKLLDEEGGPMQIFDLAQKQREQRDIINRELDIARPAMRRTLGILGGFDRLAPLSVDVECVKRASLDLRNILGLAAEASACLPKAWDPHGSLRDLKE